MGLFDKMFGRKKAPKNQAGRQEPAAAPPTVVTGSSSGSSGTSAGRQGAPAAAPAELSPLAAALIGPLMTAAAADSLAGEPGEIVVRTTSAESLGPGIGGLVSTLTAGIETDVVTLNVLVLFDPRTGTRILSADDPEGRNRGLRAILADTSKRFILRIEKANLDFLKADREIWDRVKEVVDE